MKLLRNKKRNATGKPATPQTNPIVAGEEPDRNMELTATDISVLVCRVGKAPVIETVKNDLESMQNLVGGYIEVLRLGKSQYVAVVNEEGKLKKLAPNRALLLKDQVKGILGDFFVAKGSFIGTICSVTEEDVEEIRHKCLIGGWDGRTVFW